MACYLYIIQNNFGKHYIGISKFDPKLRLVRHNKGLVISTKLFRPWHLIYSEKYLNYIEARQREKQIKGWYGGNALETFLLKAGRSSNGRTPRSGRGNHGSNPCLPAFNKSY